MKPFFITGATAKIKLNNKTLAYCTDLSYSVQIITQTPKVLGMYEGSSVEPLGYTVSGSFTVIRYAKGAKDGVGAPPMGTSHYGNGVGNWGSAWTDGNGIFARNGIGNDGRANEALDPSKLDNGTTFDIQVYQKVPNPVASTDLGIPFTPTVLNNAANVLSGGTTEATNLGSSLIGVANIRNCRITQADFQLTKRGAAIQRFSFVALYADEDSFVADFSGKGQQF